MAVAEKLHVCLMFLFAYEEDTHGLAMGYRYDTGVRAATAWHQGGHLYWKPLLANR